MLLAAAAAGLGGNAWAVDSMLLVCVDALLQFPVHGRRCIHIIPADSIQHLLVLAQVPKYPLHRPTLLYILGTVCTPRRSGPVGGTEHIRGRER
ncbi:hypothetical protein BZA05DRAFT_388125 [Tricharina praecox]|uniref:uncharacterized protein n=1 Tax=Tricharina praecox TaxID=43433 RepID=UPI00221F2F73|nr:uncharacterized protein BZA05DRAFT_388125 [Tricharina praecox]KAI5856331.1 hypothetical protein BZA05DRAFT_388125 [Tricharina praecox]